MTPLAVVVGAGVRSAIALGALETGFLLRAGAAGMAASPLLDREGAPVTMCFLPTLDPLLYGPSRALELATGAMLEALAPLQNVARGLRARLVVAFDEQSARKLDGGVVPADVATALLRGRAQALLPELKATAVPHGPAGPALALPAALDALGRGEVDVVVLGGTHTDYDPESIAALEREGRLFSPSNPNAVLPGEAAAFVVFARPDAARRLGLPAHAQLLSLGAGRDDARPDNDESAFRAAGTTAAVRRAFAPLAEKNARVGWILSDMNFEHYRLHEWQALMARTSGLFCEPCRLDAPGQRLGNLGAAAMPLHVALAYTAFRHGYAPHPLALSLVGNDSGERAATLLSAAAPP